MFVPIWILASVALLAAVGVIFLVVLGRIFLNYDEQIGDRDYGRREFYKALYGLPRPEGSLLNTPRSLNPHG